MGFWSSDMESSDPRRKEPAMKRDLDKLIAAQSGGCLLAVVALPFALAAAGLRLMRKNA